MKEIIITSLLGVLLMAHVTSAMFGLCSTHWFFDACDDFFDECAFVEGACYHPGVGDHGDGCVCIKTIINSPGNNTYLLVKKDHIFGGDYVFESLPTNFPMENVLLGPNHFPNVQAGPASQNKPAQKVPSGPVPPNDTVPNPAPKGPKGP